MSRGSPEDLTTQTQDLTTQTQGSSTDTVAALAVVGTQGSINLSSPREESLFPQPPTQDPLEVSLCVGGNESPKKEGDVKKTPENLDAMVISISAIPGHNAPVSALNNSSPFSVSNARIALNVVIVLFSALISFYYSVLAFMRGDGKMAVSWMLAACAFVVNFPQYIFVPQTIMERIGDVRKYGLYAPYLLSGTLGLAGGTLAFLSGIPLGESAGKRILSLFDVTPSSAKLMSVSIPFASAIGLTRALGTWALTFMAYNAFLLKHMEPNRYFLSKQVLADVKKYPLARPAGETIDSVWISSFYQNIDTQYSTRSLSVDAKSWLTSKNVMTGLLMLGCVPLMPMWLGLAEQGSGSNNKELVWLTALPSEAFYQWFCFTLLDKMINLTKKSVAGLTNHGFSAAKAWMITLIAEALIVGTCFASGGGYSATAVGDQQNGFGSVANDTWLSWTGRPMYETAFYATLVMFYAGFVANGGAVFAMGSKYADQKARFNQIPRPISWTESAMETTFQSRGLPSQLPDGVKEKDACEQALTYFRHDIQDFNAAKEARKAVMEQSVAQSDVRGNSVCGCIGAVLSEAGSRVVKRCSSMWFKKPSQTTMPISVVHVPTEETRLL